MSPSASGKLHPVASSPFCPPFRGAVHLILVVCFPLPVRQLPVGVGSWGGRTTCGFPHLSGEKEETPANRGFIRGLGSSGGAPRKEEVGTAYYVGYRDRAWYIISRFLRSCRSRLLSPSQSTNSIPAGSTPRVPHPPACPTKAGRALPRSALRGADLGPPARAAPELRRSGRWGQSPPHTAVGVGAAATTPRIATGPGYASPGDQPCCCQAATQKYFPSLATLEKPGLSWRLHIPIVKHTHASHRDTITHRSY